MAQNSSQADAFGGPGAFAEVLGADIAATTFVCAACGFEGRFADSLAYADGPGIVLRCPTCNDVTARLVRRSADTLIETRGIIRWRIPAPDLA